MTSMLNAEQPKNQLVRTLEMSPFARKRTKVVSEAVTEVGAEVALPASAPAITVLQGSRVFCARPNSMSNLLALKFVCLIGYAASF